MQENAHKDFRPVDLLCEYAKNPLGIDAKLPLFSWSMIHSERGQYQSFYRILVSDSLQSLNEGTCNLWDSGKVSSDNSCGIVYRGRLLTSGQTCYWKVMIWDKEGMESCFSEPAFFEMGLLEPQDWKGKWIGPIGSWNGASVLLRKEFIIKKKITKARAYISGLGYYELKLNGDKVGDHVLDPGTTDYTKRILYATYDVTSCLVSGNNVVGIILGNGWYGAKKALLQLNIDYEDGTKDEIFTRHGLEWYVACGPIVDNSILGGEIYDARLEKIGWDTKEYDFEKYNHVAGGWIHATNLENPGGKLVSQILEPIKVVGEIEPITVTKHENGICIYDIGQNMAGWVKLELKGEVNTRVTLKYAETLYENGFVNRENLRTAEAKDTYILKGGDTEVYIPRFTYHGFRYVQIEVDSGEAEILKVTAQVVRSSVEPVGTFECSNSLINQLYKNVWWTEASNLYSIPTDCPQRDERMAWLNDATSRAEEAIYNFNMSRFYQKWMEDISDTQDEISGSIADTAPHRWGYNPADPLVSCYLQIPLFIYRHYGNKRILEQHYEGLKKWVGFLRNESENFIVYRSYYGDWASPVADCEKYNGNDGAVSSSTPGELISTAYYFLDTVIISKIAHILGKYEEEEMYCFLATEIKNAFNKKFFNKSTNNYASGSQGANSIALKFGIVPEDRIQYVIKNLNENIEKLYDNHLTTGNQCTKHMFEALAENGKVETAYKIITQTTYPGYGFMISKGATTIWERWEYDISNFMNSRNHPMHAHIGAWFYKILAGINVDESACGFNKVIIKPYLCKELSYVNSSLKTVKGLLAVNWNKKDNEFNIKITIPSNVSAKVFLYKLEGNDSNFIIKESGQQIWSDGTFFANAKGIYCGIDDGQFIVFDIGSGTYSFYVEVRD